MDELPLQVFFAHCDVVCAHSENTIDNTAVLNFLERLLREDWFDPNGNPSIVFTDSEEGSSLGSRHLAPDLRWHFPDRVAFLVNVDELIGRAVILFACSLDRVIGLFLMRIPTTNKRGDARFCGNLVGV